MPSKRGIFRTEEDGGHERIGWLGLIGFFAATTSTHFFVREVAGDSFLPGTVNRFKWPWSVSYLYPSPVSDDNDIEGDFWRTFIDMFTMVIPSQSGHSFSFLISTFNKRRLSRYRLQSLKYTKRGVVFQAYTGRYPEECHLPRLF